MLVTALCWPGQSVYAQDQTVEPVLQGELSLLFRGAPLQQALEELTQATEIDLVYSTDLVAGKRAFCSVKSANIESMLRCILKETGLDYVRSSAGTYIIIESLQTATQYGDLAGIIVDVETGAPLPFANVLLADASAGTAANQDGLFNFSGLMSGFHQIVATYVGYETTVDSVWIEPGQQNRLQLSLRSNTVSVGPIVIDGMEQRWPASMLGAPEAPAERLSKITGIGTADVMRGGASSIAGVAVQQPLAGLHIQGAAGNEHLTLLDGVPVRDPVSLGRHLGAFSPLAIQRLTVHKAGFGVSQGSHLTGIVAVDHDIAGKEPYSAALMIDPISLNTRVKGRIPMKKGRESTIMAAYRSSNWDVYQDRGIQTLLRHWNTLDPFITTSWAQEQVTPATLNRHHQEPVVSFSDLHLASRVKLSPYQSIQGSFYRADNRLASDQRAINDSAPTSPDLFIMTRDRYEWLNWAGQVRHSWLLGSRSVLSSQLKGSWHESGYLYKSTKEAVEENLSQLAFEQVIRQANDDLNTKAGFSEDNHIRELAFTSTLSHSITPSHNADIGLEILHAKSRFFFENAAIDPIYTQVGAWNISGFLNNYYQLTAFTRLETGVRVSYIPSRQTAYAEPRLALRVDALSPVVGNYSLRFAAGVYRQFVNQFDLTSLGTSSAIPSILFWLPPDETLSPPRAYHFAVEALFAPGPDWTVGIETYFKEQPRLLTINYAGLQDIKTTSVHYYGPLKQGRFIVPTHGRAYGASLQLIHKGIFFTHRTAYALSQARQRFPYRFDNELQPTPWNIPHRFTFDTSATLSEALSLDLNWISQWGRTWAFRRAYYDFLALSPTPRSFDPFDLSNPAAHIAPAYHRLDFGIKYRIKTNRMVTSVQAFVINVLDRANTYDLSFEPAASGLQTLPRTLPGRQFSLSLRVDY